MFSLKKEQLTPQFDVGVIKKHAKKSDTSAKNGWSADYDFLWLLQESIFNWNEPGRNGPATSTCSNF